MKMKTALIVTLLTMAFNALASLPAVIDLKVEGKRFIGNEYIKTLDSNEHITFKFNDGRSHYVEQLMISAEGAQRNYSFAKVYADGDEVATLGVPGRDPDYPIVIRGNVSEIVLKVQDRSRIKILDFKIYTVRKNYSSYSHIERSVRRGYNTDQWGASILDIVAEFQVLSRDMDLGSDIFSRYLRPLKVAAFKVQASDDARDARSLSTKKKAEALIDAIDSAAPLFESDMMLMDSRFDRLGLDLQIIKQDMIEKYDLNRE
ncbi:MAG: hypothetical protein ACLGHN_05185 [Bacteriovoracia bacterium]